ncbi:MAG: hypothetical protein V3U02_10735 [Calditrichia bacterium]
MSIPIDTVVSSANDAALENMEVSKKDIPKPAAKIELDKLASLTEQYVSAAFEAKWEELTGSFFAKLSQFGKAALAGIFLATYNMSTEIWQWVTG